MKRLFIVLVSLVAACFLVPGLFFALFTSQLGNENYSVRDGKVYFETVFGRTRISAADAKSFTKIGDHYARDFRYVYFKSEIIEGADPKLFVLFENSDLAKDSKNIYSQNKIIKGLDPTDARLMSEVFLITNNGVFWRGISKLQDADQKRFHVIKNQGLDFYSTDGINTYYNEDRIPNCDPLTFRVLFEDISRDKDSIYIRNKRISVSDPDSFHRVKSGYADKNGPVKVE